MNNYNAWSTTQKCPNPPQNAPIINHSYENHIRDEVKKAKYTFLTSTHFTKELNIPKKKKKKGYPKGILQGKKKERSCMVNSNCLDNLQDSGLRMQWKNLLKTCGRGKISNEIKTLLLRFPPKVLRHVIAEYTSYILPPKWKDHGWPL